MLPTENTICFTSKKKKSIDYQIAATFVTENEKEGNIVEALEIIKSWNPELHSRNGMTDYCMEEKSAMENLS